MGWALVSVSVSVAVSVAVRFFGHQPAINPQNPLSLKIRDFLQKRQKLSSLGLTDPAQHLTT